LEYPVGDGIDGVAKGRSGGMAIAIGSGWSATGNPQIFKVDTRDRLLSLE